MSGMTSWRAHAAVLLCAFGLTGGCAQYMGRHYEEDVVSVKSRSEQRGKIDALRLEISSEPVQWRPVFEFVVFAERTDTVREDKVVRKTRVESYAHYDFQVDYTEPFLWIFGLLEMQTVMSYGDWHYLCYWPPVDFAARLLGSYGINGISDGEVGSEVYDSVPPNYFLRVAHWAAWVLPGYTTFGELCQKREAGEPERVVRTRTVRSREPAPRARIKIRTSDAPEKWITILSDKQGKVYWDVSSNFYKIGKNVRWEFHARAEYEGFAAELKRSYFAKDLGVTWDKPDYSK